MEVKIISVLSTNYMKNMFKIIFNHFGEFFFLHKWKDNGDKIHNLKFYITWIISFFYLFVNTD